MCISRYLYACLCMYPSLRVRVCRCLRVCVRVSEYQCASTCTYICVGIYIHIRVCVYIYMCVFCFLCYVHLCDNVCVYKCGCMIHVTNRGRETKRERRHKSFYTKEIKRKKVMLFFLRLQKIKKGYIPTLLQNKTLQGTGQRERESESHQHKINSCTHPHALTHSLYLPHTYFELHKTDQTHVSEGVISQEGSGKHIPFFY